MTWTKFERNPLENKSLEILISETLIRGNTLVKLLSRLPECPNQLTYFTNIIFFVSKLSFSVKKLKKISNGKKVMAPGSYSKNFFGIIAFQWCIDFFQFFKNYISEWLGLPEWKKYICMQKFRVLPSKLSDLEQFFLHSLELNITKMLICHKILIAEDIFIFKVILEWFNM